MTVWIATIYENGKGCVLASDQMITAHFPIGYEYEREDVEKMVKMVDSAAIYALVAGDVLFANEVLDKAKNDARTQGLNVADGIAEIVRNAYQETRRKVLIQHELEPRGLNLGTYYQSHQKLLPNIIQMIDKAFATFDPGVQILVAGMGDSSCHLYTISNPGVCHCHDSIGYAAIGSGSPHAVYSLIESGYQKCWEKDKVKEIVEKAKTRSQVAPGVGEKTKTIVV